VPWSPVHRPSQPGRERVVGAAAGELWLRPAVASIASAATAAPRSCAIASAIDEARRATLPKPMKTGGGPASSQATNSSARSASFQDARRCAGAGTSPASVQWSGQSRGRGSSWRLIMCTIGVASARSRRNTSGARPATPRRLRIAATLARGTEREESQEEAMGCSAGRRGSAGHHGRRTGTGSHRSVRTAALTARRVVVRTAQ